MSAASAGAGGCPLRIIPARVTRNMIDHLSAAEAYERPASVRSATRHGEVRHLYADDYPDDNWFYIEFWGFTGNLLYRSSAEGTPQKDDEMHVFDGKNVVEPCLPL